MNYIPAHGPIGAKLMIVGDCPTYDETKPFTATANELNRLLKDAGINRESCWLSNVSKYYVPENTSGKKIPFVTRAINHGVDIQAQLDELQNEINSIQPNCILALGGVALWALTGIKSKSKKDDDDNDAEIKFRLPTGGIQDYRGSILRGMGRKVVATYHPSNLSFQNSSEFMGYWNRQIMLFDMKRAKVQSEFPEINLSQRTLTIARSSYQLAEFLDRYKNHKNPSIDIEARGQCMPACIGIAFTPYEGMTVPLWNEGEYKTLLTIPDSDMVSMWILLAECLAKHNVIGQNFKYDQDKIIRLGFRVNSLISDTMLKAFCVNPELPKGLAFNQSIYTEEPFYKNEGMYEGTLNDLFIGCARDACVQKEIDMAMDADINELGLREFYQNFVMEFHQLYLDIESEGFTIDYKARDTLFDKYVRWSEQLNYEMFHRVGTEVNTNSPKQVAILLYETLKLPLRKGTGEEELTALLNNQGKTGVHDLNNRRIIEIVLEKRRVDKTIGNYLMAMPDYDGKMKTTYFPCLETGRSSTGMLEPPIRPKVEIVDINNKKKKKAIGTAFQVMTKHGDIGQDVRSQYIAEDGYIFVQADSAQAEARVVFLLADDEQALKDIDEHDYHALTASWFFGGTESDYSKKILGYESPIRFAGKELRHAGHLGAGKRLASIQVNTNARKYKIPISITESVAERALKTFHIKQPKIQKVFQAGVINCLERNKRTLTAPFPYGFNLKTGGKRTFFERWGDELFRQAFSYIPQRAISDNTKGAAIRLKRREPSLRLLLESHDSLLFMIPEKELNYFTPMIKEEMERPIIFESCSIPRRNLIVPCELETGYNYQEFHKFKIPMIREPDIQLPSPPKTVTEEFRVVDIGRDSKLTDIIYHHQMRDKE